MYTTTRWASCSPLKYSHQNLEVSEILPKFAIEKDKENKRIINSNHLHIMNKKILLFLLMLLPLVTSAQTSRTIHVATAGTLSDYISEDEKYQIEELTLSGELNGTDIRFIRNMSGIDYEERYMDVSDPYEDINTA